MDHPLRVFVLALALLRPAFAQCCLGEQDVTAISANGRFLVEALARNGIGPTAHGPYRHLYRFCERTDDGSIGLERGRFELEFRTRNHFHLSITVSPTGNGAVVLGPEPGPLVLYGRDGTVLSVVGAPDADLRVLGSSTDGYLLECVQTATGGPDGARRRFSVFLPLGEAVGSEFRMVGTGKAAEWEAVAQADARYAIDGARDAWLGSMIHHSRERARSQSGEVHKRIADLGSDDPEKVRGSTDRLFELGCSSRPLLERVIESDPKSELAERARKVVRRIRAATADHATPWRDRALLVALTHHPDPALASLAQTRLARIVPADVDPLSNGLVWDDDRERFVGR